MTVETKSGLFWGAVGIAIILLSIILEAILAANFPLPPHSAYSISGTVLQTTVKLLDVVGIAVLAVGLIHILIETKDWGDYFRARIREIVLEQSFLDTLDKER